MTDWRDSDAAASQPVREVDLGKWPLVGRDDEIALATSALHSCGSVVITGAAGVGKTTLAREVVRRVTARGDCTEWVTATQSAAEIPLGAVAHLVPDAAITHDRDDTLRGIVAALRHRTDDRLLLAVDDAHLLDNASATLVHHLVARGAASAVVTVRSEEPTPDSITTLWKDGPAPLIALQPLARVEVEAVVTEVLDDSVDGATLRFFWESSRGNAMFLRELVRQGIEAGALRHEGEMWRWNGPLQPDDRLRSLVALRMGNLCHDERVALEFLALGQPLSLECLRQLGVSADLVGDLERRGLTVQQGSAVGGVALAHPLFGEVLVIALPVSRRNEVLRQLADAVELTCNRSEAELFRVALWRVDAGDCARTKEIRAAANRALRFWEPRVAERLARIALEAGPEIETMYMLGAALSDQNRAEEALAALQAARGLRGPDRLRASIATDEAGVLSHQLGRLDDAERVLNETRAQVTDPRAQAILDGGRSAILVSRGLTKSMTDAESPAAMVPTAALAAMIEHATAGRLHLASNIAKSQLSTAPKWTAEFPTIELYMQMAQTWTSVLGGDLIAALDASETAYAEAVEDGADFPTHAWNLVRGIVFVSRGLPQRATEALKSAAAGLEVIDRGFLRPSCAYLAMAAALTGDGVAAERHMRAAHAAMPGFEGLFGVDIARAAAWVDAARGDATGAARQAREIAEVAALRGAHALEVFALHDAARFGLAATVLGRLETLAGQVEGVFVEVVTRHARALAEQDATALEAVSQVFASLTYDLFAAEATAAAATIYGRDGLRARAFAARERARELALRAEMATTPESRMADQPIELTPRERDVAELGASQLTSREIAERLGISIRTVENLLGRVYAKLGINGRRALAETLEAARL